MRNVERGSSQIPLVICIVLLLVATFFAYDEHGKRTTIESRLKGIQDAAREPEASATPSDADIKSLLDRAHTGPASTVRLRDLAEVTGGGDDANPDLYVSPEKLRSTLTALLTALDTGEFTRTYDVSRHIENPDKGVVATKTGDKYTVNYGGTRELRGANPTLQNTIEVVIMPAMRRMIADINRYQAAYDTQVKNNEEAAGKYASSLTSKDEANRTAREETQALDARKSQEIADLRRQKDDAEAARTAAETEKEEAVTRLTAQLNAVTRDLQMKSDEVRVLKARKRAIETDTSPDGTVTAVATGGDYVVIDLGKADHLIAGTNFDVYTIGKGGREIPKGTIKVIRVDNDTAQAQVMQRYDAWTPLVAGDSIRSLTYSPGETIHVALVGRFSKMGKSDAANRLRALGVVVDEVVGVDTHYLVVGAQESEGEPIEETAEYKAASLYGIATISENELARFTMY
jgi:hypothetical protein